MTVFAAETVQRAYKTIAGLLFFSYGLFMIGCFILPDYNLQYKLYVSPLLVLVLPGIAVLAAAFREIKDHRIFQLIVVYMLYMVASGLWSTPFELYRFGQKLATAGYILSFIILTHFLRSWYRVGFDRMLRFSVLVAAVSAFVSLLVFYSDQAFPSARVTGLGSLTNVNEFANVYGVYALFAMAYGLKSSSSHGRALYFFLVLVFIGFIWFAQSRAAFVALFMALFFLVMTGDRQEKVKWMLLVIAAVGVFGLAFPELVERAWARGEGVRPLIWQAFMKDVVQTPIFGQGIITVVNFDIGTEHFARAHNAYVQALWNGGVIGLGLLLLLIASACRQAWRLGKEHGDFVILSMLLFAMGVMLTGVDTLVERPREQWILFWFPLALLISDQVTDRRLSRQALRGGEQG